MNFVKLFDMQAELDKFIMETQNIDRDVFKEKSLALLVELSELSNETRCFKFWSTKGPSERGVILEEFVDSIHFMLSLGNMRGFSLENWPAVEEHMELTDAFLQTTATVVKFIGEPSQQTYEAVWHDYAIIAHNLQFTIEDIIGAYIAKNEENYERQRSGY